MGKRHRIKRRLSISTGVEEVRTRESEGKGYLPPAMPLNLPVLGRADTRRVQITDELIDAGATFQGRKGVEPTAWNEQQFLLIGESWPPLKGWRYRAVGTLISYAAAKRFLQLRGHCKNTKSRKRNKAMMDKEGWNELAAEQGISVMTLLSNTFDTFLAPLVVE